MLLLMFMMSSDVNISQRPPSSCLDRVWEHAAHDEESRSFDMKNDERDGDSISCAILTTPTAMARSFRDLQRAIGSRNPTEIASLFVFPMTYVDSQGRSETLTRTQFVCRYQQIFAPDMVAAVLEADFSDLEFVMNRGAYLRSGAVWWVVDRIGGTPRIVTINRSVLVR